MTIFWLNHRLNPFKLKNPAVILLRSQVVLRNAAFSSCAHRIHQQYLAKQTAVVEPCMIWGTQGNILRRKKDLGVCRSCLAMRQFHGGGGNVRFQEEKKPETLQDLVEAKEKPETAVTVGQKVAQAGKDVSYFAVILAGFAVTGALLWYVFSELFLSSSPNKVYADALKKVKLNEEVMDALGEPIKAYGEETSRGRRRHVSFQEYIVAGENYMRVKFYVSGAHRKGTVHVDVKQVSARRYEYRFIFVELDGFPPRTIIIEDNRLDID